MCIKITLTLWIHFWIYYLTLQCEDGWESHGDACYFLSNYTRNRSGASEFCETHGGLLVIDSNETIHNFLLSKKTNSTKYWIGLKRTSNYQWTSPISPALPTLNGLEGNGTCVAMQGTTLTYTGCAEKHLIICQRVKNSEGCTASWEEHSGYCFRTPYTTLYDKAEDYIEANLACWLYNKSHVVTFVNSSVLQFINLTFLQPTDSKSFWIGLSRYTWDDSHAPLHWQKWNGNYEMGTKDCVVFWGSNWNQCECSEPNPFICQTVEGDHVTNPSLTTAAQKTSTQSKDESTLQSSSPSAYIENDISTSIYAQTTDSVLLITTPSESFPTMSDDESSSVSASISTQLVHITEQSVLQIKRKVGPELIGGVIGAIVVLILIVVISVLCYRRRKRKSHKAKKGDYDASYEIAFSPNTEDKTRNSDSSLTDDEKLAQLRNRDSRVVIDSNVPDSEKIKPYLVTTIVDGHREGQPSRRSKVVSSIEDRVEYDNNNLDELIVTDNDLYHSSGSDPNRSDGRPRSTDYDYAVRPPHPNQQSQANVFINNAYDGEAEGGAGNHNQGAQIQYADIAFSTETLNKENTYADIDDYAPSLAASDAKVPTTAGIDQRGNTPGIANNDSDSGNQAGEMKAIPVYAEVDANKMDRTKNEIIDERKDAHDAEEGVNELIVTDNDLYDFNN